MCLHGQFLSFNFIRLWLQFFWVLTQKMSTHRCITHITDARTEQDIV